MICCSFLIPSRSQVRKAAIKFLFRRKVRLVLKELHRRILAAVPDDPSAVANDFRHLLYDGMAPDDPGLGATADDASLGLEPDAPPRLPGAAQLCRHCAVGLTSADQTHASKIDQILALVSSLREPQGVPAPERSSSLPVQLFNSDGRRGAGVGCGSVSDSDSRHVSKNNGGGVNNAGSRGNVINDRGHASGSFDSATESVSGGGTDKSSGSPRTPSDAAPRMSGPPASSRSLSYSLLKQWSSPFKPRLAWRRPVCYRSQNPLLSQQFRMATLTLAQSMAMVLIVWLSRALSLNSGHFRRHLPSSSVPCRHMLLCWQR
jgi:hypothetical protein